MGSAAKTQKLGNFCVKSKLTCCKVSFNCELQQKLGEQDVLLDPLHNFVGEATAPPVPRPMTDSQPSNYKHGSTKSNFADQDQPVTTYIHTLCPQKSEPP